MHITCDLSFQHFAFANRLTYLSKPKFAFSPTNLFYHVGQNHFFPKMSRPRRRSQRSRSSRAQERGVVVNSPFDQDRSHCTASEPQAPVSQEPASSDASAISDGENRVETANAATLAGDYGAAAADTASSSRTKRESKKSKRQRCNTRGTSSSTVSTEDIRAALTWRRHQLATQFKGKTLGARRLLSLLRAKHN